MSNIKEVKVKLMGSHNGDLQPIRCLCGIGEGSMGFVIGTRGNETNAQYVVDGIFGRI